MKRFAFVLAFLCVANFAANAQGTSAPEDPAVAYTKVITTRSEKIVTTLNISDKKKADRVTAILVDQYRTLNDFHDKKNARIKELKSAGGDKDLLDTTLKQEAAVTMDKLAIIHKAFLSKLNKELTPAQVEQVKDGMTYGVLPLTYKGYEDMIPSLTTAQKEMIKNNLLEARELAMDAESSDAKHAWFGKYKGRINNKLAAEGYNLTKEREEWQKRIKAATPAKQ